VRCTLSRAAEARIEFVRGDGEFAHIPGDPEEEHLLSPVDMLIQIKDVPSVIEEKLGNTGNQSLPVRA
jgi:hypothetical protein